MLDFYLAMSLEIRFSTAVYFVRDGKCRLASPKPAHNVMPGWLKPVLETSPAPFLRNIGKGFLEAASFGYIVQAPFDFRVAKDVDPDDPEKISYRQKLASDIDPEGYEHWAPFPDIHSRNQFRGAPWEEQGVVKLRGYWYFETPPGYSCLFLPPQGRTADELPLLLGICFWRKGREERNWVEFMGEKGGCVEGIGDGEKGG